MSIDEKTVAEAKRVAARRGVTLQQLIRDYPEGLTRAGDIESVIEQLNELWQSSTGQSTESWTRQDLHNRS